MSLKTFIIELDEEVLAYIAELVELDEPNEHPDWSHAYAMRLLAGKALDAARKGEG
jgi:hypothetical protein